LSVKLIPQYNSLALAKSEHCYNSTSSIRQGYYASDSDFAGITDQADEKLLQSRM